MDCRSFVLLQKLLIIHKIKMCERKIWLQEQDQLILELMQENEHLQNQQKHKWSDIANTLQERIQNCKRTGKQCRQRWHNHVDPTIKDSEFSQEQIHHLFELHDTFGNKWAAIAKQISGRTDNSIKNFFYSSLRRALKQINSYVSSYKKKSNIKPFQGIILTKLMKIQDDKQKDSLDIKTNQASEIAAKVKRMLLELSLQNDCDDLSEDQKIFREQLVTSIQDFNKCCKKRKQKKHNSEQNDDQIFQDKSEGKQKKKVSRYKILTESLKDEKKKNMPIQKPLNSKIRKKGVKKEQSAETQKINSGNGINQKQVVEVPNNFGSEIKKEKHLNNINFGQVNLQNFVMEHEMQSPNFLIKSSKLSRRDSKQSANGREFDFRNTFQMFNQPNAFDSNGGFFLLRKESGYDNNGILNRSDCFQSNGMLSKSDCLDQAINPTMFASINVQDELKKINPELIDSSFFKET